MAARGTEGAEYWEGEEGSEVNACVGWLGGGGCDERLKLRLARLEPWDVELSTVLRVSERGEISSSDTRDRTASETWNTSALPFQPGPPGSKFKPVILIERDLSKHHTKQRKTLRRSAISSSSPSST